MPKSKQFPCVAILVDIRSLYNVGSIFRTADALGISKLYLVGTTGQPHPKEPWRSDHQRLAKTALGAEQSVPWQYFPEITPLIKRLRQANFSLLSLELKPASTSIIDWQPPATPLALLLCNEVKGLSEDILQASDSVLHIPMLGHKESLNVSAAFGIAAFWLKNKPQLIL